MNRDKLAYFSGLSAFIAIFENFIPVPIPILRLGLFNIPVCLGFTVFNFRELFFMIMFKTIFSHLFRGTVFSYPFLIGVSGSLCFLTFTYPCYILLKNHVSFISISLIGSFFHNTGQLAASFLFLPSSSIIFFGLILYSIGIVTGFINGLITNNVYNKYKRFLYG